MLWTSCVHQIYQLPVEGMVERSSARYVIHIVRYVWPFLLFVGTMKGWISRSKCPSLGRLAGQGSACSLKYLRQGTYLYYLLQIKPVDGEDEEDDSAFV